MFRSLFRSSVATKYQAWAERLVSAPLVLSLYFSGPAMREKSLNASLMGQGQGIQSVVAALP